MSVEVFYIGGAGRSGSTLLSMILGNLPGFFAAGEVVDFWEHAGIPAIRCGCGELLNECPVWSKVMAAFENKASPSVSQIFQYKNKFDRTRQLPFLKFDQSLNREGYQDYLHALGLLYKEIKKAAGGQTIVDSSKTPVHLFHLGKMPGAEIRVLHLMRDPRAVAYSWNNRVKKDPAFSQDAKSMDQRSYLNSIIRWKVENRFTEAFGQRQKAYTPLKYEDFTRDPYRSLSQALQVLGCTGHEGQLEFLKDQGFQCQRTHSVGGNPVRFSEITSISPNNTWQTQMPPFLSWLLGMAALPLLKKYHYDVLHPFKKPGE